MKRKIFSFTVVFFVIFCVSAFAGGNKDSSANSSSSRYLFEQNFVENNVSVVTVKESGVSYSYMPNIGFSAGKRVIYNGVVSLLDYIIPDSALAVLNRNELQLLKNTIYAKYGIIFQSNELRNHFRQFSWYNPKSNNVEERLTKIDKTNIEHIQIFENAKPNSSLKKIDLAKNWVGTYPVPDWTPSIEIKENNTIEVDIDFFDDRWNGRYSIENGFLVVFVKEQYIGDYYINNNWHWPNGVTYNAGETPYSGKVIYNEPIKMVFPVGDTTRDVEQDWKIIYQKRQIGSITWFSSDELANALGLSMQKRAIELSKARHKNTDFKEISLIDSNIEMNDKIIHVVNTYKVYMLGNRLGIIGHDVYVTVIGQIDNNIHQVLEANIIK